tara:strand:+ start:357 stop:629 length:273 start_codon:yes stop_codon:yes gene_type:complete
MVAGDVVSEIAADNTNLVFQPAAGSEVMISIMGFTAPTGQSRTCLTNGTLTGGFGQTPAPRNLFVNNTNYFSFNSNGAGTFLFFSGVQIK